MSDFNSLGNYLRANSKYPNMGLNNTLCQNPVYWCRLHEVWLSENDVQMKQCKAKLTYDMLERRQCMCLVKRKYEDYLKNLKGD